MKRFFCLFFALCTAMPLYAQDILLQFFDNGSAGTEYYMTFLPSLLESMEQSSIRIYVSSTVVTEVTLEVESDDYRVSQLTKPNEMIEFILPVAVAQPYYKREKEQTPAEALYRQKAVHITAKDPIIVYGLTRYGHQSEGFLGIPVSALGKEYIIASSADAGDNGTSEGRYLPSQAGIVAAFDNTKIMFTLGGNALTKTSGGIKQGESKSWALQKGDVLLMSSFGQGADLSGSKIVADKPFAVVSGSYCAFIPDQTKYCNHTIEMESPTYTWGKEYVVAKIFGRQKNSFVKIMAKEPNTKVYRNGEYIATIQEAGGIEGVGYISRRLSEGEAENFVITADKPICITQFNPGQADDDVASHPFQLLLTPVEHFMKDLTFTTPSINSYYHYNYVNLVFELDDNNVIPNDLEFGFIDNGKLEWQTVVNKFGPSFDQLPTAINGKQYGVKTILLPKEAVYRLRCSSPLAAYSYGFSGYDAYAYPAAASFADRTGGVDTLPPVPAYVLNSVGNVGNGLIFDENPGWNSKLASVTFMTAKSFNYTVSHVTFIPGESSITTWNANVIDEQKPARAVITFIDRAGNDTTITLEYSGIETSVKENTTPVLSFSGFSPNPATQQTVLQYSLDVPGRVRLSLYNTLGEEVRTFTSDMQQPGTNSLTLYTGDLPVGVYVCRLISGNTTVSSRLAIVH